MRVIPITIGFAPAVQVARGILEYHRYCGERYSDTPHYVVLGHYPVDTKKNNRDIEMICDTISRFNGINIKILDPGKNLGSAQSQWWALQQINANDDDLWANADPDSACRTHGWQISLKGYMLDNPDCIVASCWSTMWDKFRDRIKIETYPHSKAEPHILREAAIATQPTPFNLSLWRYSFFKELGCIPQLGELWGEVEAKTHYEAKLRGKYHAYLIDCVEDTTGKLMQHRQLLEFKDKNMRRVGPEQFPGIYKEYLAHRYPHMLLTDTYIPDNTEFK